MKPATTMKTAKIPMLAGLLAAISLNVAEVAAADNRNASEVRLSPGGKRLEKSYSTMLKAAQAQLAKTLPKTDPSKISAFEKAREAIKKAEAEANAAQQALGSIQAAKGLVDHAKGKWIGGAEKGIAEAEAALKKATTEAERKAARDELAKWQANKEDGIKELKVREEALAKAQRDEPKLARAHEAAQAVLTRAQTDEQKAFKALMASIEPFLASDKQDALLVKGCVLAEATPQGLAGFAQQGKEQEALVDKLLDDLPLMQQMLEAGGAKFGHFGRAMEIYAAIQAASPQAREGSLQRLALATSLEHATPVEQSNIQDPGTGPITVDPVKRYLHYEKAYLAGELDPAFKNLDTWEYRLVVGCDAPDEVLAWGREMLRNYRPDHIYNPDYGWRYSASVRTDVPYGSQNVANDLPSLHQYQNIIRNGGVCGRRAFFGRFILRSFGIPTWGVTQKGHAALSHWTPKGWVINLGAGFPHSWWDKDEVPRSGADFLLETQARARGQEYFKVLRAQWISCMLGEEAYNDRKGVQGGFWSSTAHFQTVALAATAVSLGPLGQELAEANESAEEKSAAFAKATHTADDRKAVVAPGGVITIPAAVCEGAQLMNSFLGGQQLFSGGGAFNCDLHVPKAGKYLLTARVVTVQDNPNLLLAANKSQEPVEIAIPYTMGKWEQTPPVEVSLVQGRNSLLFTRPAGSRGLAIKDITLTPAGALGHKKPGTGDAARLSGRTARELRPDQLALLDELLLATLADLSNASELKPLPISISKARSRIWLARIEGDAKLVFQAVEGTSQASFRFAELTADDRAMLARLVAALRPGDAEAQGAAGIYQEAIGRTDVADEYYGKAGPDFQEKLKNWFR
jgi:hypothetical protein